MSITLRLAICIASATLAFVTLRDMVHRRLMEKQCLFWFFISFVLLLAGIVPSLPVLLARVFQVDYAPSIVFAVALVGALFGIYRCYRTNAELTRKVNELSIQISILNSDMKPSQPHGDDAGK